jgi:nitric oxide reductase large subunit
MISAGIALYLDTSASPHGYIELFVAVPVIAAGLICCALPVITNSRRAPIALLRAAWVVLIVGMVPFAVLALSMATW